MASEPTYIIGSMG